MSTIIMRALCLSLLTLVVGCLEGDPNAVGQQGPLSGSSGTSGTSRSSAPLPVVLPNACSGTSSTALTLTFANQTNDTQMRVLWVNQKCTEIDYGPLGSGTTKAQPTFVGHVWRVRDASTGALYREYLANAGDSNAVTIP